MKQLPVFPTFQKTNSVVSSLFQPSVQLHHQPPHGLKASLSTKSLFHKAPPKPKRLLQDRKERWTVAVETVDDMDSIFGGGDERYNVVATDW